PRLWQLPDAGIGRVWIKTADKLYASCGRELVAFKFPEGGGEPSPCWRAEIDGEVGSVLAGAGRLFVVTDDGSLYAYGPKQVVPRLYPARPRERPAPDDWAARAGQIMEATDIEDGYALVLRLDGGRLIEELVRQTELHVVGVGSSRGPTGAVRRRLDRRGFYGTRAAVLRPDRDLSDLPPYLASLVVCERPVRLSPPLFRSLFRVLRPYGGTLCLRASPEEHDRLARLAREAIGNQATVRRAGELSLVVRKGPLPGAGSWTHQNADVSNTVCSGDAIVKAPLGVLWFGGSSNEGILPRHGHGPCPQVVGGRILIEGGDKLRAMDVYTGRVLWETELPGVGEVYNKTYHAAGANNLGSNYVSLPDGIYVVYKDRCLRLDPATGKKVGELSLPRADGADKEPTWGSLGVYNDVLIAGADTQELYDPDFTPGQFPTRAEDEERAAALRRRLADVVRWLKTLERFTPLPRGDGMSDSTWAAMNLNKLIRRRNLPALLPEARGRDARELVESIKTYLRGKPGARNDDARLRHLNRLLLHAVNRSIPRRRHERRGSRRSWAHASSSRLVAMDRHTGKVLWTVAARQGFLHNAICAGGGKVFVIDAYPPSFRRVLAFSDRLETAPRLLALDATTGRVVWRTEDRVFGTWLAYSRKHKLLLQAYRPSRDSVDGSWGDRMNVRDARTGAIAWERTNDYGGPCLLVGDWIITQGRDTKGEAWDIRTGRPATRHHPVLGRKTRWRWQRSYGCGTAVASRHLLTFRSGSAGFFDLLGDGGTGNLGGFRSGCTSNMIVADGVLAVPDYTRTCSCAYHNQTSIGLVHDPTVEEWTYNRMWVGENVVNRTGLNLGAPGDRKAEDGTLWVDWPSIGSTSPDVPVAAEPETLGHFRHHSSLFEGRLAWVGASGRTGLRTLAITLGEGPERTYAVRLVFAEPRRAAEPGERVFDVSIHGKRVLAKFDPVRAAGGTRRTAVRSVNGVRVTNDLVLEFTPRRGEPLLCGIEIVRESK
ncbi:MAG: PQQ-binding-like beta-propeller repeat protein, partial [bacterium]